MLARNVLLLSSRIITNTTIIRHRPNIKYANNVHSMFAVINQVKFIFRRYFCANPNSAPEEQYKDVQITSLNEFKTKNCPGIKYITPKLQQLLDLTPAEVKELIRKCPKLKTITNDTIENNYKICSESGITNEILIQYPIILTLEFLNGKVLYLQKLAVDINLIAPLLTVNFRVLKQIVEKTKAEEYKVPYRNRIVYLSKTLNIPAPEISEKIIHHIYVLNIPLDRLENILKVFLDYGVEPRNILNDLWSLRYNPSIAEERLKRAIEANVVKVKTWMIRCTYKIFDRCITRQIENRTILGNHSSVEEYLSKRLECTIENAKYLTEKYPAIRRMHILKMKDTLDFLYEQGYLPIHVCRVPRILIHSKETTKIRIEQLKQLGYVPPSLAILCKSKRDFDKILKVYIKRKKNEKNATNEE